MENFDGYYVGVGQAEPMDGNLFLQRQLARRRALDQLIQSIQVTVESSMELMESQQGSAGGDTSAIRTATRRLRVASDLTVNEVTNAGIYQDPVTCILWVRLKVRRDLADNLVALKQATILHQLSVDETEATPAQKLRWINEALVRLSDVDFSALPKDAGNKQHLTELFENRKVELEANGGRKTVWFLAAPSEIRKPLTSTFRSLADTYGATYIGTPCIAVHDCLSQAREYAGKHLVWIKADGNTSSGALGMHQGTLRLGIARFDVETGSLLSTHSEEGQVFAFDEGSIDWAGLAEQLLAKEGMDTLLE
ncbi:hypothetical protein DSLASN_03380 [Desulfoluna limicola]|uniref:Uncharacterized protein n=1 Tax=Desulfoluna limicola TaxID=2810562 RepID=A0ABM7PBZ2_9BACT|nr:hypothetical protein [Desulfoluna limicola]BCS94706.1 hypothetical protein DSLASN_03380 [Desulfoluna limicola]